MKYGWNKIGICPNCKTEKAQHSITKEIRCRCEVVPQENREPHYLKK